VRPDLVLCSTAVRARATLDLASEALRSPPVQFEDELYHAWEETLVERLRRLPAGVATVMVVGHNPGLENLVSILAPAGPERLPTGALVGLRLGIDEWRGVAPGCAELTELVLPREL
jgi:phosphohistidine phosphatase